MPRAPMHAYWLAFLLLALASSLRATEPNTVPPGPPECDPVLGLLEAGLLDGNAPAEARRQAASELRRHADEGSRRARFILGSMLRAGDLIPGNPVERDLDRAAIYLSHAALDGRFDAMLVLAEIELERQRPLQALVWTQVYLSVMLDGAQSRASFPYAARLIDRSREALARRDGILQDAVVQAHVQAFLDAHAERLASAMPSGEYDRERAWLAWDSSRHRERPTRDRLRAGRATFAVHVAADGRVLDAQVLDAMPERRHAFVLGKVVRKGSFNPLPEGVQACRGHDGPRVDLFTMSVDDGSRLLGIGD